MDVPNELIQELVELALQAHRAKEAKHERNDRGTGNEILGRAMRDFRESLGLSQGEFARSIGRNQALISMIEKGDRGMSLETFMRIFRTHRTDSSRLVQFINDVSRAMEYAADQDAE